MNDGLEQWLDALGLARYAETFRRNGIDLASLARLESERLQQLGVAKPDIVVLRDALSALAAPASNRDGNGSLSALIGREHELEQLRRRWELACDGVGQVVLLAGEPGIGKSRLVQSVFDYVAPLAPFQLRYQCSPHLTNSELHPVVHWMTAAAGLSAHDAHEQRLDKLERLLEELEPEARSSLPLFASLLSIPFETRYGALDLTPAQLRHRTIEALVNKILAMSVRRPVLIVLEDAHWIDPSMHDFVRDLIPRAAAHKILIVIAHRTENAPAFSEHPHLTPMELDRVDAPQAAAIVRAVGGESLVNTIIERIVARAEGVPLYIEELTKSVLESSEELGDLRADAPLPASLQSSLVARMERLGVAKDVAQMAAVIGREFDRELLMAISGMSVDEMGSALEQLLSSGLVLERAASHGSSYAFKHALVRDAAYTTLSESVRRSLHARIIAALERRLDNQYDERVELLAHHAFNAEQWDKASRYLQRSGQRAIDRAAVREAVAQFERALAVGRYLPETTTALEQSIDLRFDLRNALWSIGGFEQILTHLNDAEELAERLDDPVRLGWISVFRSASNWQLGRTQQAIDAAAHALSIGEKVNDRPLWVGANFYLGCAYVTSGQCRRAEEYFQTIVDALTGELRHDRCGLPFVPAVIARSWLVWALAERGEFEQAKAHADEALRIAEEVGHPFNLAHIYYDIGYYYEIKGEVGLAVDALGKAYDLIREWSLTYLSPFITGFFGHVCALAGDVEDGVIFLRRAVAEYESLGLGLFRSLVRMQLADAHRLDGDLEQAKRVAESALALAIERGEDGHAGYCHRLLGEIALLDDPCDAASAAAHFNGALELADAHGMRPLSAHCEIGLARVSELTGDHEAATARRAQAMRCYRELGMRPPDEESARATSS